jgi:hypothetical protein
MFRNVFSPTGFAECYLFVLKDFFSGLVNETNLVHNFFLVYFVNIIYNLYMFRTSPDPLSGGTTVFFATLAFCVVDCLVCRIQSCIPDSQLYRTQVPSVAKNTVVAPDNGP